MTAKSDDRSKPPSSKPAEKPASTPSGAGTRAATQGAEGVDAQSARLATDGPGGGPSGPPSAGGPAKPPPIRRGAAAKPGAATPSAVDWAGGGGPGGGDAGGPADGPGGPPTRMDRAKAAYAKEGELQTWRVKNADPAKKDSKAPEDQGAFVPIGDTGSGNDRRGFKGLDPRTKNASLLAYYRLDDGNIGLQEVLALGAGEASRINPIGKSCSARNILHGAMNQSWHFAKEKLAGADASPANKLVMKKLWEYRQWHHEEILKVVKGKMDKPVPDVDGKPGKKPLDDWKAAGSASLTSDIDVNLKGTATETAVVEFNKAFKEDGWDFESGVVYDVNVYALDFMHSPGAKDEANDLVPQKEGKRANMPVGGINPKSADKDVAQEIAADRSDQEVWSLLKIAMYKNRPEWEAYKAAIMPTEPTAAAAKRALFANVELRLADYQRTLIRKMEKLAGKKASKGMSPELGGVDNIKAKADEIKPAPKKDQEAHGVAENLQMEASNRIYEEKLAKVQTQRELLALEIENYNGAVKGGLFELAQALEGVIHVSVTQLRTALSEASLYSNEAYITDGAINHTVVGLQMERPIKQTKAESMHAVNENLGDTLKELTRHGHEGFGHACYKAGKYMWRLADAARNMEVSDPGIDALYTVGFAIGNTIKGGGGGGGLSPDDQSAKLVLDTFGVGTLEALKKFVTDAAIRVQKRHQTKHSANPQAKGKAVVKDQTPAEAT